MRGRSLPVRLEDVAVEPVGLLGRVPPPPRPTMCRSATPTSLRAAHARYAGCNGDRLLAVVGGARARATSSRTRSARRRRASRYVLISDHIHPWVDAQGHSPFVWGVIGAIARGDRADPARHRGHVPADPHASGDRRARRRDGADAAGRALLPRRRHRREPERARPRRPLAARRRAARDARGGDRPDPRAARRRVRDVPRQALHRRAGASCTTHPTTPPPIIVAAKAANAAKLAARRATGR